MLKLQNKSGRKFVMSMAAATVTAAMASCTPRVTYPSPVGTVSLGNVATEPVPTVMAEAIRFANDWYGKNTPPVINLPPSTPAEVYDVVLRRIGEGEPMRHPSQKAFHVEAVRVNGMTAEVDMIHPGTIGDYQSVTIYLRNNIWRGWEITNSRPWRFRVAPPPPHYVPAPVPERPEAPAAAGGGASSAPEPTSGGEPQPQ
jgi:hypothetical protein